MSVLASCFGDKVVRRSVTSGILFPRLKGIGCVYSHTLSVHQPLEDTYPRSGICARSFTSYGPWNHRFRRFSTDQPDDQVTDTDSIDDLLQELDREDSSWWSLYVRGKVPDYPPRREMFEKLTAEGIDVERMEAYEVEDFTRWLLMRKKYGDGYPRMPYDVTLEQKIAELKRRIPLSGNSDDQNVSPSDEDK